MPELPKLRNFTTVRLRFGRTAKRSGLVQRNRLFFRNQPLRYQRANLVRPRCHSARSRARCALQRQGGVRPILHQRSRHLRRRRLPARAKLGGLGDQRRTRRGARMRPLSDGRNEFTVGAGSRIMKGVLSGGADVCFSTLRPAPRVDGIDRISFAVIVLLDFIDLEIGTSLRVNLASLVAVLKFDAVGFID